MARQTLTKTTLPKPGEAAPAVTWTAADAANKEQTRFNGQQTFLFRNSGATSRVVTITGVTDRNGRTGDITFSLAAGATKVVGPQVLRTPLFRQTNGMIYSEAAHAEVLVAVLEP